MSDRDPLERYAWYAWLLTVEDAIWACRVLGAVPISGDDRPGGR